MYERRHEALASTKVFRQRLVSSGGLGLILIAISLAVGIGGFMASEGLGFLDALLNSSMLLSGMGPVNTPATAVGKVFASIYALYSGFAVLGIAAIMLAPVVHRVLHRFHIEEEAEPGKKEPAKKKTRGR
jgi:hypothetical protein